VLSKTFCTTKQNELVYIRIWSSLSFKVRTTALNINITDDMRNVYILGVPMVLGPHFIDWLYAI